MPIHASTSMILYSNMISLFEKLKMKKITLTVMKLEPRYKITRRKLFFTQDEKLILCTAKHVVTTYI